MSGETYVHGPEGTSFRVIADHMRALTSAITDGVFPSNEGRGYVLRRLLRRAYRYGRNLGFDKPFMYTLVPVVVDMMGDAFPELKERQEYVMSVIKGEEERFDGTLETGLEKFKIMLETTRRSGTTTLLGADVFTLYDTYGFPVDLTRLMAQEQGFTVDEAGFEKEMAAQKKRARDAQKGTGDDGLSADGWSDVQSHDGTIFVGYDAQSATSQVTRFKQTSDTTALVVLNITPFYAEMGGQCGDQGTLSFGDVTINVDDTISWNEIMVHKVSSENGLDSSLFSQECIAEIDTSRRAAIRRNHTATHLLQAALNVVLGDDVSQSGSRVDADNLRFDFTHFSAVSKGELSEVEDLVNGWVLANITTDTNEMSVGEAKASGAKALFGEKYGDTVCVVQMGEVSSELCGGTHVGSTGEIGQILITSESSVASGIRRIEAVSGFDALDLYRQKTDTVQRTTALLKCSEVDVATRVSDLQSKVKVLETELKKFQAASAGAKSETYIAEAQKNKIGEIAFLAQELGEMDKENFAALNDALSDTIKQKALTNIGFCMIAQSSGKVMLAACADKGAVSAGFHSGNLVKAVAAVVKGGGGGSPLRAQAGGKDVSKISEALVVAEDFVKSI